MTARTIMVQGTASSVGKSLLTTALCRLYARRGARVAPFKSQNMALNSFVTPAGHEIGRAQAVQAEAAGVAPSVDMNPILLKPEAGSRCQVVIMGKPAQTMTARDYHEHKPQLKEIIQTSLARLRADNDLVVIEGAGSPAEVNLKAHDIANMYVAEVADAPVLLVADIDRGGVFASLVGTMELLEARERARVAGIIINKFRGDLDLLGDGLDYLRERTGVPVLGVVPHVADLHIAEEDSTALDQRTCEVAHPDPNSIDVAVIRLPHISNYDDVIPLERAPGAHVRFVQSSAGLAGADLIIIPGSKSTVHDLAWLRARKLDDAICHHARQGGYVLGLCGGYQMLGEMIYDPDGIESAAPQVQGLRLLPVTTHYQSKKRTQQVRFTTQAQTAFYSEAVCQGYEIHMGEVTLHPQATPLFTISKRGAYIVSEPEGAADRNVLGTLIHGCLANEEIRESLLVSLREGKGIKARAPVSRATAEGADYDRIASVVAETVDIGQLDRIIGLGGLTKDLGAA